MPLTARTSAVVWALAAWGCAAPLPVNGDDKAMAAQVTLTGDGPAVTIGEAELSTMAAALSAACADQHMLARSGAPDQVIAWVRRDFMPGPLTISEKARAGLWLLVSTVKGPRWDLRIATPTGERMGLLLQVPLVRTSEGGWRAEQIDFVKVSPAPAR